MDNVTTRDARLARALAALNVGQDAAAREACLSLLSEMPEDPAVRQLMATVALRANELVDAEQHVTISLRQRPRHLPTLLLAGQIAQSADDLRLAATRLDHAATLDPARADVAFARCRIEIERASRPQSAHDESPDVASLINDLQTRFPDFAPGWTAIAADLERAGQLQAALVAIIRAITAAPSVPALLKYAQLALQLAHPQQAAEALKRALDLDPGMAPVWFKLGVVLQDLGRTETAIRAYEQALALKPDMAEAAANLGILLQESGDLDAARRAYGQALRARADSFGRIAQALTAAPKGELWLDLGALRSHLMAIEA